MELHLVFSGEIVPHTMSLKDAGLETEAEIIIVVPDTETTTDQQSLVKVVRFDLDVVVHLVAKLELAQIIGEPREPLGDNPCWYHIAQGRTRRLLQFGSDIQLARTEDSLCFWKEECREHHHQTYGCSFDNDWWARDASMDVREANDWCSEGGSSWDTSSEEETEDDSSSDDGFTFCRVESMVAVMGCGDTIPKLDEAHKQPEML
eukprot:TRINITY_DN10808_c0_g1_i4.p1 TRINITY_DN10808_c0_g1~~TRINITY_DN10808_c0_g1_i4.p1  ORF type:complete len:205 (-),score=17.00 TRINITY_DN10808_c0_g1_i4:127-741(-)